VAQAGRPDAAAFDTLRDAVGTLLAHDHAQPAPRPPSGVARVRLKRIRNGTYRDDSGRVRSMRSHIGITF
jgi:hypothetical protein